MNLGIPKVGTPFLDSNNEISREWRQFLGTLLQILGGPLVANGVSAIVPIDISLSSNVTGVLTVTSGGTGISSTAVNALLYAPAANTVSSLTVGSNSILTSNGTGVPAWSNSLTTLTATNVVATLVSAANVSSPNISSVLVVATTVSALTVSAGTVLFSNISGTSVSSATVLANTVSALNVSAKSVSATTVVASTVSTANLSATAVSAITVAGITVSANTISAITVSATTVTAGSVSIGGALLNFATGTFTPTIEGETSAGAGTYSNQQGNHTRIGDRCFFNLRVTWSATTGIGNLQIGGLPFTSNAGTNTFSAEPVWTNLGVALATSYVGVINPNTAVIKLYDTAAGAGDGQVPIQAAGDIIISGSYLL